MASIISLAHRARELREQLAECAPIATAAHLIALRNVTTPQIKDLLALWCNARLADGWQESGVKRYRQQLDAFLDWAGEDLRVDQLSRQLIATYKVVLGSRPTGRPKRANLVADQRVSPGTTRNALTALRAFCAWCIEFDLLEENPALAVKHPRVVPPPPLVLSRVQIRELLSAIDVPPFSHKETWPRNRRCICLMLYAGLRREEVTDLRWKHVDLERRELSVWYSKGGKSRMVPICAELTTELARAGRQPGHHAVVDQGDGKPLGYGNIGHVFERWLLKRWSVVNGEAPPLVSPHTLRRTFATELYIRGVDLLTIQRLLGHSDPKTTLRYIAASSEKEHQAVEQLRFREDLIETERTSDAQAGVDRLCFREEG